MFFFVCLYKKEKKHKQFGKKLHKAKKMTTLVIFGIAIAGVVGIYLVSVIGCVSRGL